jgi:hypothetical protein
VPRKKWRGNTGGCRTEPEKGKRRTRVGGASHIADSGSAGIVTGFWADVKGLVTEFFPHHELSKAQGREFVALKSTDPVTKKPALRPRNARQVVVVVVAAVGS